MKAQLVIASFAFAAISAIAGGCGKSQPVTGRTPNADVAPAAVGPVVVDTSRKDLVFRYLDPSTGEVATAASVDAIPAPARREVVVYDPSANIPAGYDLVADLSQVGAQGGTATATPRQSFAFATRAAATPSSEAPPTKTGASDAGHEIIMFSTEGCGYCAKARRFFADNRVPYTELDLDEDPKAPGRLSDLGRKAGLTSRDMQGVPIFFIDGSPVLGWDPTRLNSLLGLHG